MALLVFTPPALAVRTLTHPPIITTVSLAANHAVGSPYRAPVDTPYASWKHYWKSFTFNLSNLGPTSQSGTLTLTLKSASLVSYGPPTVSITHQICFRRLDPAASYSVSGVYARKTNLSFPAVISIPFVIPPQETVTEAIAIEALGPIPLPEGGTPTLNFYANLNASIQINSDQGAVVGTVEVAGMCSNHAVEQSIQSAPALSTRVEMLNGGRPF